MCRTIDFYFNKNDPKFFTKTLVVNDSTENYVSHVFITSPIYDVFGIEIGYKVANDYVQQIGEKQYSVVIDSTYYIKGKGTISWNIAFINEVPNPFYRINEVFTSNITSTTGEYFGKTGAVSLTALENGIRNVTIGFNF